MANGNAAVKSKAKDSINRTSKQESLLFLLDWGRKQITAHLRLTDARVL